MTVSVDSIKKIDSLNTARQLNNKPGDTTYLTPTKFKVSKKIVVSGRVQSFSSELNEGAWNIYKLTEDKIYLSKALQWSKKAVEFYESVEAMDTYARLLYKTASVIYAIEWEMKAIELRKKRGFPTTEYEGVLAKMQNGLLLTD